MKHPRITCKIIGVVLLLGAIFAVIRLTPGDDENGFSHKINNTERIAPSPTPAQKIPNNGPTADLRTWLATGGWNGPDDDRKLFAFYQEIEGNRTLSRDQLLELILDEFPAERRAEYVSMFMEEAARENPLDATRFLDLLPPGDSYVAGVRRIARQAGMKGIAASEFVSWANSLGFPESRERVIEIYATEIDWANVATSEIKAALSLTITPASKRALLSRILASGKTALDLGLESDPIARQIAAVTVPLASQERIQRSPNSDTGQNRLSAYEQRVAQSEAGSAAFNLREQDFGFKRLQERLRTAQASDAEVSQTLSGW